MLLKNIQINTWLPNFGYIGTRARQVKDSRLTKIANFPPENFPIFYKNQNVICVNKRNFIITFLTSVILFSIFI